MRVYSNTNSSKTIKKCKIIRKALTLTLRRDTTIDYSLNNDDKEELILKREYFLNMYNNLN